MADVLINLLIKDLRILESSMSSKKPTTKNMDSYVEFLNAKFGSSVHKQEDKKDIPTTFPQLAKKNELKVLWGVYKDHWKA